MNIQELCTAFVEESCGSLCSQIFAALAQRGRLSKPQIQYHLRVPSRQLRHALAVLTQQHLVRYHTVEDEATYYQADWRNSYYLVRSNRIISLVEDRHGEGAAKIISNLLQLGHARVGDLAQAFDLTPTSKRDSGIEHCSAHVNGEVKVNGVDASHNGQYGKIATVAQFHNTLRKLLRAGFLLKFGERMYKPAADLQGEVEELVIADQFPDRKVNGPRKQAEFKAAVNNLKRKWREEDAYSEHRDVDSKGTIRRAVHPVKRARLNGTLTNGHGHGHGHDGDDHDEENAQKLPNEMILRVNYAQCAAAMRSDRLAHLAEPYLGPITANVYSALLHALEAKIRAKDEEDPAEENAEDDPEDRLPSASTVEVADLLEPGLDLNFSFHADLQKAVNRDGKKVRVDTSFEDLGIKEEVDSDEEEDDKINGHASYEKRTKRLHLIEDHLRLLEEHPKGFCRRVRGAGGGSEWLVSFPALTDILIQADIDATVAARFGKLHTRIIRLLRERGRLEEKQVAALVMMRIKDVRAVLTELQYAGFAEAQEVPKDNYRQPSRSVYLWFHDQTRVQSMMIQHTYLSMTRALQRLAREREAYKTIIEKAEMTALKDLTQSDRELLSSWRELEERLVLQVERMDELVALFRDFSGRDTALVS